MNFEEFRKKHLWGRLDTVLTLFDLVLSAIFLLLSYLINNIYIKGVGVGLLIAGVTSALVYFIRSKNVKP